MSYRGINTHQFIIEIRKGLHHAEIEKAVSIVLAAALCLWATPVAAEEPAYALAGTINAVIEIMDGAVEWVTQDTGNLNIDLQGDSTDGAIFTAYKLLEIDRDSVTNMLEVSIPANMQTFWDTFTGVTNATISNIKAKLASITPDSKKSSDIVDAFVAYGPRTGGIASTSAVGGAAHITTDLGFYAVLQTGAPIAGYVASAPILVCLPMQKTTGGPWYSEFTVVPKDDTISVTKQVKAAGDADFADETIASMKDEIEFVVTAELPEYGADILAQEITYTLSDALPDKFGNVADTRIVELSTDGINFTTADTALYNLADDGNGWKLTLNNYAASINGTYKAVRVRFKTYLLSTMTTVEGIGNTNPATLTYTSAVGQTETANDSATVYTMALDITKVDKVSNAPLAGAEFEVYEDDGTGHPKSTPMSFVETLATDSGLSYNTYTVFNDAEASFLGSTVQAIKVSADGTLRFNGLNDAKYYLKETKSPTGYNLPRDLFEITVAPSAADYNAEAKLSFDGTPQAENIQNSTGIDLPTTGGVGTILFTVVGVLLMAGAAYFLFRSKKKSN